MKGGIYINIIYVSVGYVKSFYKVEYGLLTMILC